MASSIENARWMEWVERLMGGAPRYTLAATFPPDRFYCLLDELPLHLIPRGVLQSLQRQSQEGESLYLNPNCVLCAAGRDVPDELADRMDVLSGFALQGGMAWVRDAATQSLLPYWLGPQLWAVLEHLHPDEPLPSSVNTRARSVLAAADILLPEGGTAERIREREEMVRNAAPLFREKGYAPLSSLIHPFHFAALRRYYRYLVRTGAIELGDGQSPLRYVAYNEPVARFFHHHIAATLSSVAGEPLKPSYVYLASYLSGAELKKHTDRAQCEFSITLCLDFSPEPVLETPWPIRLDTPAGSVTVYQALGDGLAYRGTRLPHSRGVLAEGRTSTSIFFHYVSKEFTGSLD